MAGTSSQQLTHAASPAGSQTSLLKKGMMREGNLCRNSPAHTQRQLCRRQGEGGHTLYTRCGGAKPGPSAGPFTCGPLVAPMPLRGGTRHPGNHAGVPGGSVGGPAPSASSSALWPLTPAPAPGPGVCTSGAPGGRRGSRPRGQAAGQAPAHGIPNPTRDRSGGGG